MPCINPNLSPCFIIVWVGLWTVFMQCINPNLCLSCFIYRQCSYPYIQLVVLCRAVNHSVHRFFLAVTLHKQGLCCLSLLPSCQPGRQTNV
jgi:hypothetical protein